ncbi:hypothetical protein ACFX11_038148 [Malus domestica]
MGHPLGPEALRPWIIVLVIGAIIFVRTHVSMALKLRGDGNPGSYVHSNIVGWMNILKVCKSVNLQPLIVWGLYGGIRHSKEEYKKWWEEEGAAQLRVKDKRKVLPIIRNGDVKFTHANVSFAHKELRYNLQARDRFGDRAKEVCVVVS